MFQNLKHKNHRKEVFKNMGENAINFHISPSANTSTIKGNEADRMVNEALDREQGTLL